MSEFYSAYMKPKTMAPPLQPLFCFEHSTRFSSEREVNPSPAISLAPSMAPVVEKAQHDPHAPWFLTPVTAPFAFQSISSSKFSSERSVASAMDFGLRCAL